MRRFSRQFGAVFLILALGIIGIFFQQTNKPSDVWAETGKEEPTVAQSNQESTNLAEVRLDGPHRLKLDGNGLGGMALDIETTSTKPKPVTMINGVRTIVLLDSASRPDDTELFPHLSQSKNHVFQIEPAYSLEEILVGVSERRQNFRSIVASKLRIIRTHENESTTSGKPMFDTLDEYRAAQSEAAGLDRSGH